MKMAAPAVTPPIATQAQGRMWAAPFLWASSPDPTLGNESPCSPHIEVLFGMRKTGLFLQSAIKERQRWGDKSVWGIVLAFPGQGS